MTDSTPQVIVAGDVSIDSMDALVSYTGPGAIPNWQLFLGTCMTPLRGGALLLADLVAEALSSTGAKVIMHQLPNQLALTPPDQVIHSFQIKERAKELFAGDGVKIDSGVLRALLLILAFVMKVTRCHPPHPASLPH